MSSRTNMKKGSNSQNVRRNQPLARSYNRSGPGVMVSRGPICVDLEFGTVAGSTSYSPTLYEIQPGLDTFTGLSTELSLYDRYKVVKRVGIRYSASNAVMTTPGIIYLGADFDPNDAAPPSSAALTNYEYNVRGSVNTDHILWIPASKIHEMVKTKKVRCGPVSGDYSLYDMFNLIVATDDCTDTSDLGKLSLIAEILPLDRQYDVTAKVPRNVVALNLSSDQAFTDSVASALNFDESVLAGFTVSNASGVYTLPCGTYLIIAEVSFKDTSIEAFSTFVEIKKDGASLSPPVGSSSAMQSAAASINLENSLTCVVSSATSFTIEVECTLGGTAGTLTARGDNCRLTFLAM